MDPRGSAPYRGPPPNGPTLNAPPPLPPGPRRPSDEAAMPGPLRPSGAASRAEQYEDEKRRITATCFNKLDEQGKPLQSYITHIRVQEDSVYQSSAPPPNHPAHHKKPRVVIVAVKSNGRVTMHKARENDDASFQIGKTWPMEELQSIESFSSAVAKTPEEETRSVWAGPTGFIITMTKPYYWQANTQKEKDFFIGSLVRIYNKYTEGKVPTLIGFEMRERDQILGATQPPQAFQSTPRQGDTPSQGGQPKRQPSPAPPSLQQPAPQPAPLQPPSRPFAQETRNASPSPGPDTRSASATSSEFSRPQISGPRALPQRGPSPAQSPPPNQPPFRSRAGPPQLNQYPSQDRMLRQQPNREQIRPGHVQTPPSGASPRLTPRGSRSNMPEDSNESLQLPVLSPRRQAERSRSKQDQHGSPAPSTRSLEPQPLAGAAPGDRWRSMKASSRSPSDQYQTPPGSAGIPGESIAAGSISSRSYASATPSMNGTTQNIPERRRPPMNDATVEVNQRTYPPTTGRSSPRPMTPQGVPLAPSTSNSRSVTPSISQIPAYDSPAMTPTETPTEEREIALPDVKSDRDISPAPKDAEIASNGITQQAPGSTELSTTPAQQEAEQYRPGLGPMLNKKADVANKMRKAALAHNAFKPRAGGAGARLLGAKAKTTNEPDGITGVVPARSAARVTSQDGVNPPTNEPMTSDKSTPLPALEMPQPVPSVQVLAPTAFDSPATPTQEESREIMPSKGVEPTASDHSAEALTQQRSQRPSRSPSRQPRKRRSNPFTNALANIEIDPYITQGRELDYEEVIGEFGWGRHFLQTKKMDALEADVRREVGRLEAGSWLGHSDQKDERVEVVEKLLDKAIAECDVMEGLLTLYSVELSTLTDDIAYIEAQSQGLQVQTANQKLLHTELQNLVKTISLDTGQLEPLRGSSLGDFNGLESIESSLLLLHKALRAMEPASISTQSTVGSMVGSESTVASMRALQERKDSYTSETSTFLHRLRHYIDPTFGAAFHKTKDALARSSTLSREMNPHDFARSELWRYSPLMLFAKEVNSEAWDDILRAYQGRAREAYQDELRDSTVEWKRRGRKMAGEEQDALFTAQEKESEGLTSTARKLTVKRSQTLARGLRQASEKKAANVQNRDANQYPFEVFAGALGEMLPLIGTEQNFVVDFFHATTLQDLDFTDAVAMEAPSSRRGTDLLSKRPVEPDRVVAKRVTQAMENIFPSWPNEMQSLVDWAVKQDQFQGVGILCAIERALQEHTDTSQEFIVRTLTRLHDQLAGLFTRFVDDQVRSIEATKVKIKKRKGVMAFIKIFPSFSAIVENMVVAPTDGSAPLEIRSNIDNAYDRINKAMFSSLKQIAKEVPTFVSTPAVAGMMGGGGNAEHEDKEALNHEILLIENMFHYYTEVDERTSPVLGVWRGKAILEMSDHQDRYVSAVIRRPLGRLLDFLEGLEALGLGGVSAANEHSTYSRAAFRKLISAHYDAKEFKRGIDALRKRVEKHFGESSEDLALNQRLVAQILAECERKYVNVVERVEAARTDIYAGEVEIEFTRNDVTQGFKR